MSKPRSRLFDYADTEFREVHGFTTELDLGKQTKHMPGHRNDDPSRSTITLDVEETQNLIEQKAGTGNWESGQKETVEFGVDIGIYRGSGSYLGVPTTRGTIHYSNSGAHLVGCTPRAHQSEPSEGGAAAISYWYHPIEESQVGAVVRYEDKHPGAHYLVEFADGERYVAHYANFYESENGGELGIDVGDTRYDEFYSLVLEVEEVSTGGRRPYNEWLSLDYRDFPAKITDADTGTVIYSEPGREDT